MSQRNGFASGWTSGLLVAVGLVTWKLEKHLYSAVGRPTRDRNAACRRALK